MPRPRYAYYEQPTEMDLRPPDPIGELRPGSYRPGDSMGLFEPSNPFESGEPQQLRPPADSTDVKIVTPFSVFSSTYAVDNKFRRGPAVPSTAGRSAIPPNKFRKGPLGDYETEDVTGIMQPSEKAFPPQKRELRSALPANFRSGYFDPNTPERLGDYTASALSGLGSGVAEIGGWTRQVMDAINKSADKFVIPRDVTDTFLTKEQIQKAAMQYFKNNPDYLPGGQRTYKRVEEGPLSPEGETIRAAGEYVPYTVAEQFKHLKPLINMIFRSGSYLP